MICRQANVMQSVTVEQIGDMGMEVYVKHEPSSSSGGGLGGTAVIEGGRPPVGVGRQVSLAVTVVVYTWHPVGQYDAIHKGYAVAVVVTGQSVLTAGTVFVVSEAQAGTMQPDAVGHGRTVTSVKHGHVVSVALAVLEVEAVSPEAPVDEADGLGTCVAAAAHKATMVLKALSEKNIVMIDLSRFAAVFAVVRAG